MLKKLDLYIIKTFLGPFFLYFQHSVFHSDGQCRLDSTFQF